MNRKERCPTELGAGGAGTEPGEAWWGEGEFTPVRIRGGAWMRVTPSSYLDYHPGPAAAEVLIEWNRVHIEFKVDGETRKPCALRLTQAQAGQFGYKVRLHGRRRPWLSMPTNEIGWSPRSDPRVVEETVSENEIVISLPFEFRP
jgi:hypothetical protein